MARDERVAGGVRSDWMFEVNSLLQSAVSDLLVGDRERLSAAFGRVRRELPQAINRAESLMLRQCLLAFVNQGAAEFHRYFHAAAGTPLCAEGWPLERSTVWCDTSAAPETILSDWVVRYTAWFRPASSSTDRLASGTPDRGTM